MSTISIPKEKLTNYVKNIFLKAGLEEEAADITARHIVFANLRGVDSHGVTRVSIYCKRLAAGTINPHPQIRVERETPASALLHADNGIGIYSATKGMEMAIEKAKKSGIAVVGVYESNHCGMLAAYTLQAAQQDCIAMATTNAPSLIAPWGGKEPFFGTNPFSYAVPVAGGQDIVFDMATSVAARGKILLAKQNNQQIPLGWALTKDGEPTTDPNEALEGIILPVGGHKGYGLMVMVEVLSALFTGAQFGPHVGDMYKSATAQQRVGHTFIVIRADLFQDLDKFKQRMHQFVREIKSVAKLKDTEEIYLPGELERIQYQKRAAKGIPLSRELLEDLTETAHRYGISERLI